MIDSVARLQRKRENGEDGFTLIELLVVVVIIGVLIAIAVPLYLNYRQGANDRAAESDVRAAVSVLEQCIAENNTYPTAAIAVAATGQSVSTTAGTCAQKINTSANTKFDYFPETPGAATYLIEASNTKGSDKTFYCYASETGAGVKKTTAAKGAYADAC